MVARMSRDDGFAVADMDSAYFDDAKMRDLWQRLHDADRMARAVVIHAATLLGSWRQGERISATQAVPLWMVADAELVEHLQAVKLLDRAGRISPASWTRWFGTAHKRREARREIGRAGGLASGKSRSTDGSTDGSPTLKRDSSSTEPVRPSVPTGPSLPVEIREIPPPPAERGRRKNGTNPRAAGDAPRQKRANPRANGTSTRQVRADQKRGPTKLRESLLEAMARHADDPDELPEFLRSPEPAAVEPADEPTADWLGVEL